MKAYDVVIVGGGPGGLSAALALGRGRASTLLVDGGTPRNARAHELHNFVTRDGTPPADFRAIAKKQLEPYSTVEVQAGHVQSISKRAGSEGGDVDGVDFEVAFGNEIVGARKILLAVGMRDVLLPIPGYAELWGTSIFQCPYCHGWELKDRPWGALVESEMMVPHAPLFANWASHLTVFTNGAAVATDSIRALGIAVETDRIERLVGKTELEGVELATGRVVPCAALVSRPPQKQVDLVLALGLELDEMGFVRVDPRTKESSIPGIHVVGDATTMVQAAMMASADGGMTATILNHAIVMGRLARKAGMPATY